MSHLPLFASFPFFPPTSQTPTTLLEHDEHLGPCERSHCDDLRQSGGFTQTVTPTGYVPKIIETNVDAEAFSFEDLEPRRIELDRNPGTDPYHVHERFVRSSPTEDMEEFRKKLVPMCLTSSHRCIPNTIQLNALQTRTSKMDNAGFTTAFAESRRL